MPWRKSRFGPFQRALRSLSMLLNDGCLLQSSVQWSRDRQWRWRLPGLPCVCRSEWRRRSKLGSRPSCRAVRSACRTWPSHLRRFPGKTLVSPWFLGRLLNTDVSGCYNSTVDTDVVPRNFNSLRTCSMLSRSNKRSCAHWAARFPTVINCAIRRFKSAQPLQQFPISAGWSFAHEPGCKCVYARVGSFFHCTAKLAKFEITFASFGSSKSIASRIRINSVLSVT